MKLDEIIALSKSGFTADEIRVMIKAETPADPAPADPAPADPAPADPAPAAPPAPAQTAPNAGNEAILQAIQNLTKTIQANAILTAKQPTESAQTAEDILLGVLTPANKK